MEFEEIKGKTLTNGEVTNDKEKRIFTFKSDKTFERFHTQDSCESISVEDVVGGVSDLIDSPVLEAQETTSDPMSCRRMTT